MERIRSLPEKLRVCWFLGLIFLSSYGYIENMSLISIILKDLNLLLDSDLAYAI